MTPIVTWSHAFSRVSFDFSFAPFDTHSICVLLYFIVLNCSGKVVLNATRCETKLFFFKCSKRIKGLFPSIHFRFILPLKLCWTNCLREPRLPSCRDHFSFNLLSTNLAFVFPSTMAIRFVTINVDEKKHLSEEFTFYRGNEPRGLLDEDEKSA